MRDQTDQEPAAGDNPYVASSHTDPPATATFSNNDDGHRSFFGCIVVIWLAVPMADFLVVVVTAGGLARYIVLLAMSAGFAGGAALGAMLTMKINKQRPWTSCRWAIYGLMASLVAVAACRGLLF